VPAIAGAVLIGTSGVASAQEFVVVDVPVGSVERGPAGSTLLIDEVAVDPALVGQTCEARTETENQESAHADNNLLVTSGGSTIVIADFESEPGEVTEGTGTLTLGTTVRVDLQFGPDEVSSGGFTVILECTPTTASTTTSTTTPDQTFAFSVRQICINDAPYLQYSASIPGFAPGTPMVLHWLDQNGVEQFTQNVTLGDGQVVWPGAEVAEQGGEPVDWPGWVTLPNGEWIQADDGFVWARGSVGIFATVNPTSPTASASYPLPSPDCRVNPPNVTIISTLPGTGSSNSVPAVLAGALLAIVGAAFVVATRSRGGAQSH
jgi:LPXTG-motif cell wall-anchored protein